VKTNLSVSLSAWPSPWYFSPTMPQIGRSSRYIWYLSHGGGTQPTNRLTGHQGTKKVDRFSLDSHAAYEFRTQVKSYIARGFGEGSFVSFIPVVRFHGSTEHQGGFAVQGLRAKLGDWHVLALNEHPHGTFHIGARRRKKLESEIRPLQGAEVCGSRNIVHSENDPPFPERTSTCTHQCMCAAYLPLANPLRPSPYFKVCLPA